MLLTASHWYFGRTPEDEPLINAPLKPCSICLLAWLITSSQVESNPGHLGLETAALPTGLPVTQLYKKLTYLHSPLFENKGAVIENTCARLKSPTLFDLETMGTGLGSLELKIGKLT